MPKQIQEQAKKAYRQFKSNPYHPGLRFKQVHPIIPIYPVRIAKGCRAVAQKKENKVVWFWIGSHSDYDDLLNQL